MDGQQQRQALSAAENALHGLVRGGQPDRAVRAAAKAEALDQVGLFAGLEAAVAQAATEVAEEGAVSAAARQRLLDVVGPGPLEQIIEGIPHRE